MRESLSDQPPAPIWPLPAVATGVGSMPGIDARESTAIVVGEFGAFPHVVQLPARGPGGDPVGRSAAMLADVDRAFEVETTVSGWRVGHAGQGVLRRARAWMSQDLEVLEESVGSHRGPVKVQVTGPITLAARITDSAGEALLRDRGAVVELSAAAAAAFAGLVTRMQRAFPHADVVVQVDEPDIPAVLAGEVRTSSGRLTYRSLEPPVVQVLLQTVMHALTSVGAIGGIRCFRPRAPIALFRDAGAQFLGVDLDRPLPADDALAQAWEDGIGLLLGCVPVRTFDRVTRPASDAQSSALLRGFMSDSGFSEVPANVAITPSSGLAGVDLHVARRVMEACVRVGSIVRDEHPEVDGG